MPDTDTTIGLPPLLSGVGTAVDSLTLDIDYHIIEHFSKHLYSSPNKAIEELVCNGFDAWASEVRVFLPGRFMRNHVLVLDDGSSMDPNGLKELWRIADSPKTGERVALDDKGQKRRMIGKFGIGKLASYTVGSTITHFCRRGDDYFAVEVDYRQIVDSADAKASNPKPVEIRKVESEDAREFVQAHFAEVPQELVAFLDRSHWTAAIIGHLKTENFPRGRLKWVLGNGMPLRPDFSVWVDNEIVASVLASGEIGKWDFGQPEIQEALEDYWRIEEKQGTVAGKVTFGKAKGLDPNAPDAEVSYASLPNLGRIWGSANLFERSLISGRAADTGRSHGFFILVRGRLVNQEDDKLFLKEPSFGTFYKSQFILNVDGLDDDLLADREHVLRDSPRAAEVAVAQRAMYMVVRKENDAREAKSIEAARGGTLLPIHSRELFRGPFGELLSRRSDSSDVSVDLSKIGIDHKPRGQDERLVVLSTNATAFEVNALHPFVRNLELELGTGKKAKALLRVLDQIAVADALQLGHLYELGLSDEQVEATAVWREKYLRAVAAMPLSSVSELATALDETSYQQGAPFETAIAEVLDAMGFLAKRDGASGKNDGFLRATCGPQGYLFTFEAKGSKNTVANDTAEVGGAVAHRDAVGAEHAVIVARKFAGFDTKKEGEQPAIIQECNAAGRVSIMTNETLIRLLRVVRRYGYPLDVIKEVLTTVESPKDKLSRIDKLANPTDDFDWKQLLADIWKYQGDLFEADAVPVLAIKQGNPVWAKMTSESFYQKLFAIESLAPALMSIDQNEKTLVMKQKPEIVIERIQAVLMKDE